MKQTRAIYPGSFDPVHLGHLDVIMRSTQIFSSVIIAVAASKAKGPLFGVDVRIQMLRDTLGDNPAIEIAPLDGLLVDFARERDVFTVIRGLRVVFVHEFPSALMLDRHQLGGLTEDIACETVGEYGHRPRHIADAAAQAHLEAGGAFRAEVIVADLVGLGARVRTVGDISELESPLRHDSSLAAKLTQLRPTGGRMLINLHGVILTKMDGEKPIFVHLTFYALLDICYNFFCQHCIVGV